MTEFLYFLASVAISMIMAPRPVKPKPLAFQDFEAPTADENRPIPVIFGTVTITGANVVWYGDSAVVAYRK